MTSRGTTVEVQRDIGGYRIEVEVEHVKGGLCDVAVRVKGQDGKAVDGLRLSLFAEGREQASYLTRQGQAVFDGVSEGEYSLTLTDRSGSAGTILLKINEES
jgi:hypothetical protein